VASRRLLLFLALLLLSRPVCVAASEESQRLTAKGEVAFQQERWEAALAYFELAVANDAADATAHYDRGLALGRLGRWPEAEAAFDRALALRPDFDEARRGRDLARQAIEAETAEPRTLLPGSQPPGGRRWSVYAGTGVQYDTNVTLTPRGLAAPPNSGKKADVGFLFSAGGYYDVIERPDALFRLEYDLYQTLHPDLDDFDFRANRVRGTLSYRALADLWAGVQGGYNHYTLGPHSYLGEPFIAPFLSYLEGEWGLSQAGYRHGGDTYFSTPFNDVRDGPNQNVGASQTFFFAGDRYVLIGYGYRTERPSSAAGNDFEMVSHQGYAGVGFPVWWQVSVDLMYLYRLENYTEPNSFTGFRKRRHDYLNQGYVSLSRPITEYARFVLDWYGSLNGSNIPEFAYRRNVVSAFVEVRY
jgi:tetratricopeptide (TPR) repeat protein